ncbi:8-amino-7-oxononanoate synthase [Nannizzia gypsea CBS 118893]|uniref:8-amino-7-oxononanoate synthase n=1 Tax=Arthroderma gypseum (strain ATCC MYA-4604 / CBS 118893) TaxID=535722 RepID=E5R0V6_ARTGP|nr:8-amino-7-oxononanoate synthase [Nannizzia gypsea CBS 118893]EFQ98398.1 8-amino-7-oxononanoate synthase [Nannizzia gypsea CBS 118893]
MLSPPGSNLQRSLREALEKRESKGTLRALKVVPTGAVDFSSNDFLSLSTNPTFRSRFLSNLAQASSSLPLASTGSRLLDGNSLYAEQLEQQIASFHNAPCGLIFNSGFDANSGVFTCIPQPGDVVIYDELIHASVHDGMRLSRARKLVAFIHNSVEDFERVLEALLIDDPLLLAGRRNVFVALESIYSMDGDFAPIREILDMLEKKLPHGNGHVIVDEAHATGVFGTHGAGVVQQLGVEDRVLIRLHTFGKALASNGAIILCSPLVREYLINYARPLIFTSALGMPSLAAVRTAYELMEEGKTRQLQLHLQDLIQFFHEKLMQLSPSDTSLLEAKHSPTSPIFSLQTKYPRELSKACQDAGLMVRAIMPPTVQVGTERVRVCLHSGNNMGQVLLLSGVIEKWVKEKSHQVTENRLEAAKL